MKRACASGHYSLRGRSLFSCVRGHYSLRRGSLFPCVRGHYCLREGSLLLVWGVCIDRSPFVDNLSPCRIRYKCSDLQAIHVRGSGVRPRIHREYLDTRPATLLERSLFPCVRGLYSAVLAANPARSTLYATNRACVGGHYYQERTDEIPHWSGRHPPSPPAYRTCAPRWKREAPL